MERHLSFPVFKDVKPGDPVSAETVNAWADALEELYSQNVLGAPAAETEWIVAPETPEPWTISARIKDGKLAWKVADGNLWGDGLSTERVTLRAPSGEEFEEDLSGGESVFYAAILIPMETTTRVSLTNQEDSEIKPDGMTYQYALGYQRGYETQPLINQAAWYGVIWRYVHERLMENSDWFRFGLFTRDDITGGLKKKFETEYAPDDVPHRRLRKVLIAALTVERGNDGKPASVKVQQLLNTDFWLFSIWNQNGIPAS